MKKESFSLCIILRNTICATLVFLVMLSAPTGWVYDLWAGEGTEQGQRPRACLKNKKYTKHLFMASFSW